MSLEGKQLDRYNLRRLLGSGGMGEVYLADDTQLNRQVAIKVISAETATYPNPQAVEDSARLFRREAQAVASLEHPRILPLYDYGEATVDGASVTYLATPYRQDGSFANWLQHRTTPEPLPLDDIAHFISQMAEALQYVHDHQIVHRDVKPSNFLIRQNKLHPQLPDLVLADFGIAQIMGTAASVSVRGTPGYMAPEQWEGHPVPATDQYALAAIAYELLTGQTLFQGTLQQVMFHHLNTQPPPPNQINHRVPPAVDAVLLRALAKRAEDRFPSVSAFASAFRNALPSRARPENDGRSFVFPITQTEQQRGTRRSIMLPEGQQVVVAVPAGAQEGQVVRLDPALQPETPSDLPSSVQFTVTVRSTGDFHPDGPIGQPVPSSTPPVFGGSAYQQPPWNPPPAYSNPISSGSPSGPISSGSPSGPISSGSPSGPIPSRSPSGPISSGPPSGPTPNLPVEYQRVPYIPGPDGPGSAGTPSAENLYYPPPSGPLPPRQPSGPLPNGRNGRQLSTPMIITLASVAALLIISSTVGFFAWQNHQKTISDAGTATAQARANATATATTAVTPASDFSTPVLVDPLGNNNLGNGWQTSDNCKFADEAYQASISQTNTANATCQSQRQSFSNFYFQVHMKIVQGDCGGIAFRMSPSGGYLFEVCQDGTYTLYRWESSENQWWPVHPKSHFSSINTGSGQTNIVAIEAKDNRITAFINETPITPDSTDSTYSQGYIGVIAVSHDNPTTVSYTDARVWV